MPKGGKTLTKYKLNAENLYCALKEIWTADQKTAMNSIFTFQLTAQFFSF